MKGTTWIFLCVIAGLLFWKYQTARRSPEEVAALHQEVEEGALLLDVRSESEFNSGHLEGALNIPVGQLSDRLEELEDKKRSIVVYCESGGRSGRAAKMLQSEGYESVHDLGSWRNWE